MITKFLLAAAVSLEAASFFNASKIATGVETPMTIFSPLGPLVALDSQATISYRGLGEVRLLPVASSPPAVISNSLGTDWSAVPVKPVLFSKVDASASSQFGFTVSYVSNTFRDGRVDFAASSELARSHVDSPALSGAQTTASKTIRIAHTGAQALDYFVEAGHPNWSKSVSPASSLTDTFITYYPPKQSKSKAAVDIYANGLPIWASERTYLFPPSSNDAFAAQLANFGAATTSGDSATIYLGRLSAGMSLTITLVARGEAHAEDGCAPPEIVGPAEMLVDCFALADGVSWPNNVPIALTARKPVSVIFTPSIH